MYLVCSCKDVLFISYIKKIILGSVNSAVDTVK
jgi:hypothetical protein